MSHKKVFGRGRHTLWLLLALCVSLANSSRAQSSQNKKALSLRGALRHERSCFDVHYYDLSLKIIPDKKRIEGHNKIYFSTTDSTSKIQIDLFKNLKLLYIRYHNQRLRFVREHDAVWVYFPEALPKHTEAMIDVYYEGKPKADVGEVGRNGFHWQKHKGKLLLGVSCEQIGASLWWPNKDHLSDEPDSMRVHWTVPNQVQCISNGRLEKVTKDINDDNFFTHHYLIKNPINNYSVTLYLGDYNEIQDEYQSPITQKKHPISYYYYSASEETAQRYFSYTTTMLAFFEETFGEYPFWDDKFSVVESNYLGMEHQGCLAIGSNLGQKNNWYYGVNVPYGSTLIHEIAHEWWGNSVSVADMADVWLHESFATYAEVLFVEKLLGKDGYEAMINYINTFATKQALVGKYHVNSDVLSTGNIYMNGVIFLDKLREKIDNDAVFFDILKSFQNRYRKKVVCTQDFINMVNEKTGVDYGAFFKKEL